MQNQSSEKDVPSERIKRFREPVKPLPLGTRVAGLDGLKAIAIIGVTLFHMFPAEVRGGYLGVSLFLLITGYLLAYTSASDWKRQRFSTLSYFWKRIKRIYPSLLIVILTTIGVYTFLLPEAVAAVRPEVISIVLGYNNWWQIHQHADYFTRLVNTSPFTHLWFMGIELQYFLLWPILFGLYRFVHRRVGSAIALSIVAMLTIVSSVVMPYLYVPGQDVTRLYYGTDTRIYALLLGALLGLWRAEKTGYRRMSLGRQIVYILLFGVLLAGVLAGYIFMDGQNPVLYQGAMLLFTIAFAIMVMLATPQGFLLGKLLDTPVLRWIGHHCYGIFLWQYPVLYLFQRMHWEHVIPNPYVYNGLIVAAILLLTVWSDTVSDYITQNRSFSEVLRHTKKFAIVAVTFVGFAIMSVGVHGFLQSSDKKVKDLGELQSRLTANAATQQEENEKAAKKQAESKQQSPMALEGVACIGDSVMLGASNALRKDLPNAYVDAKVSRYVGGGLEIAKQMQSAGHLGKIVLIGLGTNGPITGYYEAETKALLQYLEQDKTRKIFWVNIYGPELEWEKSNNQYLESLAKEHPNLVIVDWHSLANSRKDWLSEDGIHPSPEGSVAYAQLVKETMQKHM